jgi:hypothetical protein
MKNKSAFWFITIVLSIIVIYALVNTVLMPVLTMNPLPKATIHNIEEKEKPGKGDKNSPKDDTVSDTPVSGNSKDAIVKLFELRKKEVLLHSRLALASEDSMYLVLDLVNNIATLEMKGVSLHECRILHSNISNSIIMYRTDDLLNWMAEPFMVKHVDATIPKISFVEKMAPKDSIEANKAYVEPAAAKLGDVYMVMDFERNLRLVIEQAEKPDAEGKKLITALRRKYQGIEISRSLQSLIKFNRQPAMPQIDIVLPKSDATILHKALPLHLKVILKM